MPADVMLAFIEITADTLLDGSHRWVSFAIHRTGVKGPASLCLTER
jgi:hypothetical protein